MKAFYKEEPGVVVSMAIDKYVYVIAKRRFDDEIHVVYSKKEVVSRPEDVKHDLVREALLLTGSGSGLDVITTSDIPSEGSGLGSSSAVTVGLLNALYTLDNKIPMPRFLAEQACHIEIEKLEKPIGKQDQYACSYGGLQKYTFHAEETVIVEPMDLVGESLTRKLHLFYTNRTRQASDILERQQKDTDANRHLLQGIKNRASWTWDHIKDGQYDHIGWMLHESWMKKQLLAPGITNPDIDNMYERAREAGATGGKVCGAGGGGFLLLYVDEEHRQAVRDAMEGHKELPFEMDTRGSTIILNQ